MGFALCRLAGYNHADFRSLALTPDSARGLMTVSLDESFAYCRTLTRRTAGNFYFSFLTLPGERRRDMCALYAFMRVSDDLGDEAGMTADERRTRLTQWRDGLERALAGDPAGHVVFPALADVVRRCGIPPEHLAAVIDGVAMDLEPAGCETFGELADYCYHVAGAVGLCCIHVWGFHGDEAIGRAIDCGTAFQLTNILRDLGEDAAMGRVYLPREDLDRFGYSPDDLRAGRRTDAFHDLMRFEAARAREHYARAERLFDDLEPAGRPIFAAMLRIYGGLLEEIERRDFDVFSRRARLPKWRKLWIAGDSVVRHRWLRRGLRRRFASAAVTRPVASGG
jgi:phytoene synthase